MLYVLWGPDSFSRHQEVCKMKSGLGQPEMAGLNCTEAEAPAISAAELASLVQTMPFLSEKRLVIIRGLLAPFEPRQKPGATETAEPREDSDTNVPKKETSSAQLLEILSNLPPTTDLALVEEKLTQKNSLFSGLPKETVIREFPLPAGAELERWITQRASELGGSLNSAAAHVLAESVGPDLWTLDSEVQKLLLYVGGQPVSEADVRLLVSQVREASVFALVDAVMAARAGPALGLAHQLLDGGTSVFRLLNLLARQMRLLLQAKEMTGQGATHQDMAGALGVRSPWAARKLAQQAEGYSYPRLKAIYRRLVDEDLALKTGKRTPELGLDLLVVELCGKR